MDAMMQEILHTSYGPGGRTPIPRASGEQLRDRAHLLVDTSHLVQLYASPKVALSARLVAGYYAMLVHAVVGKLPDAEREDSYRKFQKALVEAEAYLRHDLEVGWRGRKRGGGEWELPTPYDPPPSAPG